MKIETLQDLFVAELSDVYSAEKQLTKALPKMAKHSSSPELAEGFNMHLRETEGQIDRLEQVAQLCDFKIKNETCEAMKGLVEEAEHLIKDIKDEQVLDAALITAAQKVEHYEIASYGSLCAIGKTLGIDAKAIKLLEQTLEEEKSADVKLTTLAERGGINKTAFQHAA